MTRPGRRDLITRFLVRMAIVIVTGVVLIVLYRNYLAEPSLQRQPTLRVLSYSTFLNAWGPGREIALAFERETGIAVEYRDAGDGGLLLKKLELFPSDVVVGLDQLSINEARLAVKWRKLRLPGPRHEPEFVAFDYSPMTFIYKEGELGAPPTSIEQLVDARFAKSLSLQDPRTSTPGLQFLFWILDQKGVDEGFALLSRIKPNVRAVSPNWAAAYGLFTQGQAKMVFSYQTSPLYHLINESDDRYRAVQFKEGLPLQIEYAGLPDSCTECDAAQRFILYLLKPEIQKLIMTKNFMLPVNEGVKANTPFDKLPSVNEYKWRNLPDLLKRRDEIFERWRKLGLG